MQHFKIITYICLSAISLMVIGNIFYLHRLYISIKDQTVRTIIECVKKADISEMIMDLKDTYGIDDSFLRINEIVIEGLPEAEGRYSYSDALNQMTESLSLSLHEGYENDDSLSVNFNILDSLFICELNKSGLYPQIAYILPHGIQNNRKSDLWKIDFSISPKESPIYDVYVSPLRGKVLLQMSGIIITSSLILIMVGFLIWFLIHCVSQLRSIEQMKDDFTHNMTHELKTPVAVAYSAADSMLRYYDQSDEARNRQFLKIIMQRLSYLSGMIENILSMSMERFKTMTLNMESVALRSLVDDVAGMIKLKADKPVKINIKIPEDIVITADSLHLGNIISNLVDNAVKYSGDSVDIFISADSQSMTIADNGIGISRENLPYIFDKFYRVSSGDRYEVGGYGLGLYYVKQTAGLLGWSIEVTSKEGEGTRFTIKFTDDEKR